MSSREIAIERFVKVGYTIEKATKMVDAVVEAFASTKYHTNLTHAKRC